jgi:hypothetical protein
MPTYDMRSSEMVGLIASGAYKYYQKAGRAVAEVDVSGYANRMTASLQKNPKYVDAYGGKQYKLYPPLGDCDFTNVRQQVNDLYGVAASRIDRKWVWHADGDEPLDALVAEVTAGALLRGCFNPLIKDYSTSFMLAGKTASAKSSVMLELAHALNDIGRCKYLRIANLGTWKGLEEMSEANNLDRDCWTNINKTSPSAAEQLSTWIYTTVAAAQRGVEKEPNTFSVTMCIVDAGELLSSKPVVAALAYANENKRHCRLTIIADNQYNHVVATVKDYFDNILHTGISPVPPNEYSPTKEMLNGSDFQITGKRAGLQQCGFGSPQLLAVVNAYVARKHRHEGRHEKEKTLVLARYRPQGTPVKPLAESTTVIRSTPDAFTRDKVCFNALDTVGLEDYLKKKHTAKLDDAGVFDDLLDVSVSQCTDTVLRLLLVLILTL